MLLNEYNKTLIIKITNISRLLFRVSVNLNLYFYLLADKSYSII